MIHIVIVFDILSECSRVARLVTESRTLWDMLLGLNYCVERKGLLRWNAKGYCVGTQRVKLPELITVAGLCKPSLSLLSRLFSLCFKLVLSRVILLYRSRTVWTKVLLGRNTRFRFSVCRLPQGSGASAPRVEGWCLDEG